MSNKKKLIFIIGDYSSGAVGDALAAGKDLSTLRSGDSADLRVLNTMVEANPDVAQVITLPVAEPFNPGMASAMNARAVKLAFDILEHPEKYPEYAGMEIHVVNNVAPGIRNVNGESVVKDGDNADREPFTAGTVKKNGKTVYIGGTSASMDKHGHTFSHIAKLKDEGYDVSPVRVIADQEFEDLIKKNGQFRSRVALAYTVAHAGKMTFKGDDLIPKAKALAVKNNTDEAAAIKVFEGAKHFLPVREGNARRGFVTVITESENVDAKLKALPAAYDGQLASGLSYNGNEFATDKEIIAGLSPEQQRLYRETRLAHLAAQVNEFDIRSSGVPRTIILDPEEQSLKGTDTFDVTLKNGARIITSNPKLLALTVDTVKAATNIATGKSEILATFLQPAHRFAGYLRNKAIENDCYGNVKMGLQYEGLEAEIAEKLGEPLPSADSGKVVQLTIIPKTGKDENEEFTAYYNPGKSGSFDTWGYTRASAGSTLLNPDEKTPGKHQVEFFTPGFPTARNICTVIPGVTSFAIDKAVVLDRSVMQKPSSRLSGLDRASRIHAEHIKTTQREAYARV